MRWFGKSRTVFQWVNFWPSSTWIRSGNLKTKYTSCQEVKIHKSIASRWVIPHTWNVIKRVHYGDVTMSAVAYQIIFVSIVYLTVWSGTHQRKHQCSALLASVRGIHRWPVNSPQKGPATRKRFPFDEVIRFGRCLKNIVSEHIYAAVSREIR